MGFSLNNLDKAQLLIDGRKPFADHSQIPNQGRKTCKLISMQSPMTQQENLSQAWEAQILPVSFPEENSNYLGLCPVINVLRK